MDIYITTRLENMALFLSSWQVNISEVSGFDWTAMISLRCERTHCIAIEVSRLKFDPFSPIIESSWRAALMDHLIQVSRMLNWKFFGLVGGCLNCTRSMGQVLYTQEVELHRLTGMTDYMPLTPNTELSYKLWRFEQVGVKRFHMAFSDSFSFTWNFFQCVIRNKLIHLIQIQARTKNLQVQMWEWKSGLWVSQ